MSSNYQHKRHTVLKILLLVSLALAVLCPRTVKATDTEHFAVAYALQTFTYGLSKRALRLETHEAIIFSAVTTAFLGLVKEATDRKPSSSDMFYNLLGQGASVSTCLIFDF